MSMYCVYVHDICLPPTHTHTHTHTHTYTHTHIALFDYDSTKDYMYDRPSAGLTFKYSDILDILNNKW